MPRLAICSRDLHWHWINRTLFCDTMEVSMLSRAWLTIAQHVFQPALTGRPELISRKIVSGEPGTKAIAVSRFRENCLPRIGSKVLPRFREKYRALGRPKNGVQHATAIYPIPRYTWPRYIGLTLYKFLFHQNNSQCKRIKARRHRSHQHFETWIKWFTIYKQHFQKCIFLKKKLHFYADFIEIYSQRSN